MPKNWPMWLGLVLGLGAIAFAFATQTGTIEQWNNAAKYTARVGFPLLILAYVARPLVDLTRSDWSKAILAKRKYIGLGFAMSHTVHLAALVTAIEVSGEGKGLVTYVFGGLAYAILYAMAFTSKTAAMKAMGKWWKRLHRTGIHYLWFIFLQSYVGRIFREETMSEGVLLASVAIAAGGIRFAAWIKQRNRRAKAVTA
ncbi:hypothetical protein G6N82_01775 [Altererythrobacter sp. BO-6]|uniref:hypothetical protein n=1 Tax=Altererythrobacter sp. BO-6 TaxID=2604537 RepID=UPI0013E1DC54|nr:hypothetical protein [Altererythrobacter sp. BO-6]QIG53057.1 hypothetical protein G6N82_01775 [Altererythrobacter sp. BO-6]